MPRRDAAGRTGAQLAELVRLDHGNELVRCGAEEQHDEVRAASTGRVDLRAGEAELEIRRGHHRERAVVEPEPVARPVLDRAGRQPPEARLDRVDGLVRRQQRIDVGLGEIERHGLDSLTA